MKKILFFAFNLLIAMSLWAEEISLDSIQSGKDSVSIGSHTEFSTEKSGKNITKSGGDSAYIKNDYKSAIQIYEALLEKGEAAEVYYNLGNCYYKTNDIAKSILNYERALLLDPGNTDIRVNLEMARAKTVDKITPIPDIFFVAWIKSLINCLSVDAWAKCGILFFILFLVAVALFFFSKQASLKKGGFIGGIVFLILVVLSNVFASQQKAVLVNRNAAIVLVPSVTVRSTPSESGTSLFILHEGSKVELKDNSMREWKEIRLEDGKVGWVPTSSIEVI
ncbi:MULTISPECIES: tetratricopeptide repeat protein [Bacteroides]|jgi:tetratricopeptide (TPR) repeat protein|uniref:tetratricopeptide repeat protein n=1 Tax=Bacteroides TaxID=816 RepID=UPI00033ED7C4|nr:MULTISPECIES: tetratricopeptide repeat protein [Bacteroides]CDB09870.1 tetratricopeptide repeat protein [Bacteroides sp. CAG:633]